MLATIAPYFLEVVARAALAARPVPQTAVIGAALGGLSPAAIEGSLAAIIAAPTAAAGTLIPPGSFTVGSCPVQHSL